MLTGKEQWKILQKEDKRMGREKRRKKTLTEQLQEMGGFGHDPNGERAIIAELECWETRAPLQHCHVSLSEYEESFGESYFWRSRKRLFHSWIFQASRPNSWIQKKDLPLFFRFALCRPILDEWTFQSILQMMGLQLDTSRGNARQPYTRPIGRSRQLMLGIDGDQRKNHHSSDKFRYRLPRGAAEDIDRAEEEAARIVQQDDDDMQEIVRRQLWTVYEHVQNGSVPLETATWHYRDVFDNQDISNETLVISLQQFGIPTDHISTNERKAHQGKPSKFITELGNYIALYRVGILQQNEVIPMIQDHLGDFKLDVDTMSDILTDLEKDEITAALLIWEDVSENNDASVSGRLFKPPSSPSSSEKEEQEPHQGQENSLGPVIIPQPHASVEKDHEAAVALPVEGSKPPDLPTTEDMDHLEGFKEDESKQLEAMRIDQTLTSPPAMPLGKLSTYSHAEGTEGRMLPPATPRPKSAPLTSGTEKTGSQADVDVDWEPPSDRANVGRRRRSSSPDDGMTTGIWGLLMPTKEARDLAYKMKLPQDTIDLQVHSISPRRVRRRRASFAKTIVTFPRSKRKASMALHRGTSSKSPKQCDHLALFAREGEDQEKFVLSHFDRDEISLDYTEPVCPECLQESCTCNPFSRTDEATQTASQEGNPSSDAPHVKLVDRTRSEPPKQSVTLLACQARALDDYNVLASMKQLERLPPADTTVADAKRILDRMQQDIRDGKELDIIGTDFREAIRILTVVVQSSEKFTGYTEELHREATEGNDSTLSVDDCHNELQKSPDLDSGLLNNSRGHKHVLAPPSDPFASAAAFSEKQSNVANNAVSQADTTPLAKDVSSYLPISAPDDSVPRLKPNSGTEDAAQPSRFQKATAPDSSAAGDRSRARKCSSSPGGGECSTAGGHPSQAGFPPEPPAGSPLSSSTDLSEQVSENPVDAEVHTDETFRASHTRQPHSDSCDMGNGDILTRLPPSPRPETRESDKTISAPSSSAKAKQLPDDTPPPSPRQSLKKSSKSVPPATPRLGSIELSRETEATSQIELFSPGYKSLPVWPPQPGLSGKAGTEWMGMTPRQALERAKEKAFNERKSLTFYLEERRAIRTRIKKENDLANSNWFNHSFFQSSNGVSGSSGSATTQALKKLFDKYRGTSNI